MGKTINQNKGLTSTAPYFKYQRFDTFCSYGQPMYSSAFYKPLSEITDLEMISRILLSPKKRILVYCGGGHARSIVPFLRDYCGFTALECEGPEHSSELFKQPREIDPARLDFLDA